LRLVGRVMIFREDLFCGKHVLVTGASSGIGRATAILLAQCGASLTLCGRDEARLIETKALLSGTGHKHAVADFGSAEVAHDILVEVTKDDNPLSVVFHAAGLAALRMAKLYNEPHVEKIMIDGGSIIFMSSVAGSRGRAGMGVYASAKAAIGGLTRALAAEFAPRSIRVNEIVAGAIETPMHHDIVKNLDAAGEEAYRSLHLLGFGQAGDIANAVVYLASPASNWITGSSLAVDGGYMAT
jgi:NAD(P)-dependent dehydrogenase (short-subunit alcohol dehydrogenase family)